MFTNKHFVISVDDIIVRGKEVKLKTNCGTLHFTPVNTSVINVIYFFEQRLDYAYPIYVYDIDQNNKRLSSREIYMPRDLTQEVYVVKSFKIRPKHIALYVKLMRIEDFAKYHELSLDDMKRTNSLKNHIL